MIYEIVDNIWKVLSLYVKGDNFILVTDTNVYSIYKSQIDELLNGRNNIYIMEAGEENKSLVELANIYEALVKKNIDREGIILSLGGGVVGDMTGFAAATYKRGIGYIQIPTTLLAQTDSSVGGKTAIDFLGHKNIIGSFYFPLKSYIDTSFLSTLSDKEITCGLGEIIKYGIIEDYDLFKYIGANIREFYAKDEQTLLYVVERSLDIKTTIVEKDKLDLGIRQKLNFGHTVGHGIESYFQYKKYNHGESVILGMMYESNIAYQKSLIDKEYYDEIIEILKPLVKPTKYNENEANEILRYMKNDKKNKDGKIGLVLPIGKGEVDIFYDIDEATIKKTILNYY